MARTYQESFTLLESGWAQVGPNFSTPKTMIGGPGSSAFYLEVNGRGAAFTESEMRELFAGFLKVHDYYTEHGVSFE